MAVPALVWWGDDPRTTEMAAEVHRSMEGKAVAQLGAVAADVVRPRVKADGALLAAAPHVVLSQDVGTLAERVDAAGEVLGLLTRVAPSPAARVAALAEEVLAAIAGKGEDASSLAQAAEVSTTILGRRALAIALGTVTAAYAGSVADIPALVLGVLGGSPLPTTADVLVAEASSVAIQAVAADRAAGSVGNGGR
jgi:hypothetical protein